MPLRRYRPPAAAQAFPYTCATNAHGERILVGRAHHPVTPQCVENYGRGRRLHHSLARSGCRTAGRPNWGCFSRKLPPGCDSMVPGAINSWNGAATPHPHRRDGQMRNLNGTTHSSRYPARTGEARRCMHHRTKCSRFPRTLVAPRADRREAACRNSRPAEACIPGSTHTRQLSPQRMAALRNGRRRRIRSQLRTRWRGERGCEPPPSEWRCPGVGTSPPLPDATRRSHRVKSGHHPASPLPASRHCPALPTPKPPTHTETASSLAGTPARPPTVRGTTAPAGAGVMAASCACPNTDT